MCWVMEEGKAREAESEERDVKQERSVEPGRKSTGVWKERVGCFYTVNQQGPGEGIKSSEWGSQKPRTE